MKNNSKAQILGSVINATFDLEKDKIKKDDDLKTKMGQMLEVADKVKGIFECVEDFNLFLKIFNQMEKSYTKKDRKNKEIEE